MTWRVITHADVGVGYLEKCADWVGHTAPEEVAREASEILLEEAWRAFERKANPRTGEPWKPAVKPPGIGYSDEFGSLLLRTRQLRAALVVGYQPNPAGARGFLNLANRSHGKISTFGLGMIHLYGAEAKKQRSYKRTLKSGRVVTAHTERKRKKWHMPARGFIGISPQRFRDLIKFAEAELGKVLK